VLQKHWSSPFISFHRFFNSGSGCESSSEHEEYVLTRGKGNKLHIVDPNTLEDLMLKETGLYSVFSTYQFKNYLLAGCFNGYLYVFDESKEFKLKESKRLTQGVYDIIEYALDDQKTYLVFAEHFGNIEILNQELKVELQVKPEKINTIFQMIKLTNKGEIGLCAYNGVYFIKINLLK
jgi:hypothetical protein